MSSVSEVKGQLLNVVQGVEQARGGIQMFIDECEGKLAVLMATADGSNDQAGMEAASYLQRAIEDARNAQGAASNAAQSVEGWMSRL
jgi:hypothetical protein